MHVSIHAGMHKTGTTMFQRALRHNSALLETHGVRALTPRNGFALGQPGFLETQLPHMLSRAAKEGVRSYLLSHEAISLLRAAELAQLRAALRPHAVTYVVMFRHWCGYLPARWAQNCKRRDSSSFPTFLTHAGSAQPWMRFDRVLLNARDAGFEDRHCLSFEAAKTNLLSVLSTACSLPALPEQQIINPTRHHRIIDKIRLFNAARADATGQSRDAILDRLEGVPGDVHHFKLENTVTAWLGRRPDLDATLDALIDDAQTEVSLDPEQFADIAQDTERMVGHTLFRGIKAHSASYSTLAFADAPHDVQQEILSGLHTPQGWIQRALNKIRPSHQRS